MKRRILFIEDNPINQFLIEDLLEELGFDVEVVDTGTKALNALKNRPFELVLMSIDMDGLNVDQLIVTCGEDNDKKAPVIIGLVDCLPGAAKDPISPFAVDGYLFQPFNLTSIGQSLDEWLSRPGPELAPSVAAEDFIAPPLDSVALLELEERYQGERKKGLIKLVHSYQQLSTELVTGLAYAVESNDANACYQSAHSLKSCSANLAALQLSRYCSSLEQSARSNSMVHAVSLFASIKAEHGRVLEALEGVANRPLLEQKSAAKGAVYPESVLKVSSEIMVVDDDPTARMLAQDALMNKGFKVMLAEDG